SERRYNREHCSPGRPLRASSPSVPVLGDSSSHAMLCAQTSSNFQPQHTRKPS
ncbi:hypothetical protein KUCAC02_007213, partial [Chaenocephalus aceratus]